VTVPLLLGAIAGDIIGSPYEHQAQKTTDFPLFSPVSRFTDDTVLTVAVAEAILMAEDYAAALRRWGRRYPHAGYGGSFRAWLMYNVARPYGSFGNGSAMRVSPVGWGFDSLEATLEQAERSAAITHDHPEGIKGAQAVAQAIYLARKGAGKDEIRRETSLRFGYALDRSLSDIRPNYEFNVTCQGSVPEAIIAFLESTDFESSIRNAVSLGGDADTLAAIAGAIGEAFYGPAPEAIATEVQARLPEEMWQVLTCFFGHHQGSNLGDLISTIHLINKIIKYSTT
jgi:ADP-ribosylglycohydrolase